MADDRSRPHQPLTINHQPSPAPGLGPQLCVPAFRRVCPYRSGPVPWALPATADCRVSAGPKLAQDTDARLVRLSTGGWNEGPSLGGVALSQASSLRTLKNGIARATI